MDHRIYQESRKTSAKLINHKKMKCTEKIMNDLENDGKNNAKLYGSIRRQNRRKNNGNYKQARVGKLL